MSDPAHIRILIAEDHNIVRQGFIALLRLVEGFEVVAEASDGVQALALFRQHRPDVTLMDLRMPGSGGGETGGVASIKAIRREFPEARIIVLTTFDGDEDIYRALQAGARAYLLKGMTVEVLVSTIRSVHAGKSIIPPSIAQKLAERMATEQLTQREQDVLEQIVRGKSNKEIGVALDISEATVKTHINNLLGKLGVEDRTQAATAAIQRGLVQLESQGDLRI
jgi:DNA-binding NarL/FixJ family response regulator